MSLLEREIDVQIAICEYLRAVQHKMRFVFFSVQNESLSAGKTRGNFSGADFGRLAKSKKAGLLPGVSDLVLVHKGRFYALEVKNQKGKLSDYQREFRDSVLLAGGEYAVVRSLDDVIVAMKTWGIK